MNHYHYAPVAKASYTLCILANFVQPEEIRRAYLTPYGIDPDDVIIMSLHHAGGKKKTPVKEIRAYLNEELLPALKQTQVQYVLCTDTAYFKELADRTQAEANLGYVLPCKYDPAMNIQYIPSWKTIFYDPVGVKAKIAQTINALREHVEGTYQDPGAEIITFAEYPRSTEAIAAWLEKLLAMDCPLAIDIEAFSLKFYNCGIGTITFCWNKTEGIAFPVDYVPIEGATEAPYGYQGFNKEVRDLLKSFFIRYLQKSMYHNITFDVTVLIYQLFMTDICDVDGMQRGLDILMRNWDCTKLITYLATNSCGGNQLSLKDQAQAYSGNYGMGEDIKDITAIPIDKLLKYNLVDGLGTWYVYEKHWDTMVADDQLAFYTDHFQKYAVDIVEMQLTGLPVIMDRAKEVDKQIRDWRDETIRTIQGSAIIAEFRQMMAEAWAKKKNETYKVKRVTAADCPLEFNPGSSDQLQGLLFDLLELPVISYTKTKQPSTDAKTIKTLLDHKLKPEVRELLQAIQDYAVYSKVLDTFMPAILSAQQGPDGWFYLFGSYNLGGAISGRLSSSDPNMQNLPVKGKLGKLLKSCFGCDPNGEWLFVGLDFASLEDRISALTTKDPNKLKVYTDGYDGHCLRAYAYFNDQMPDIDPSSVESINSIEEHYKELRGESKAPTFALTYQGTWITLMKNCGFSEQKAKSVENSFKVLYKVSIDWVDGKLDQAAKDGYITGAFGLRVRTPLLAQTIRGTSRTPYEAEAEGRSAGNALGQSWCLLNNRASAEFMGKVRGSEYRKDIRLGAHIHDAQYFRIRNNMETLMYVNEHLVKAVQWQDHPDIWHDEVKLGGELSVFYPDWGHELELPNYATEAQIQERIDAFMEKLNA